MLANRVNSQLRINREIEEFVLFHSASVNLSVISLPLQDRFPRVRFWLAFLNSDKKNITRKIYKCNFIQWLNGCYLLGKLTCAVPVCTAFVNKILKA